MAQAAPKAPTKTQILANIAEATNLSKKDVAAVFDALTGEIETPEDMPLPCDLVESDSFRVLGRLAAFVDRLKDFADFASREHPASEWIPWLKGLVSSFFQ